LAADETIDAIFALGPTGAAPALSVLEQEGLMGEMLVATFDLSPEVLEAIRDGNMLFAVDQQQYTQGYLSIVYMTLFLENLNTPGQVLVPTGPGFVTQDTAAAVIDYAARGTR
jgi:simple sugar transport system substrate-binding protein